MERVQPHDFFVPPREEAAATLAHLENKWAEARRELVVADTEFRRQHAAAVKRCIDCNESATRTQQYADYHSVVARVSLEHERAEVAILESDLRALRLLIEADLLV